jgi:glycosyltransferase involved in cell wall biosynthesis
MVISEHIQQDFENLAQTDEEKSKIVRIYNPLDTEEVLNKAEIKVKSELKNGEEQDVPLFVSVGTVFPQKGFDRLLKVHKRLLDEGFAHRVQILGDGYDFENIKKLQEELGITASSKLLGFTDNPYTFIKKADFYILSSRYEGFPTVLFEAITLKKKIIATDVSGVNEMLEKGKLGLIVENSEEGIYEGMKNAITNSKNFNDYSENLKDYEMPFNLENSVNTIMKIIDDL